MEKETLVEVFDFGQAINLLKEGKLVARTGWNGKGMFIFMRPGDSISEETVLRIKTLPTDFKEWIESHPSESGNTEKGKRRKALPRDLFSGKFRIRTAEARTAFERPYDSYLRKKSGNGRHACRRNLIQAGGYALRRGPGECHNLSCR